MQLWNIQQQTTERVEVYYERLLKLANYLQVKTIDVFFTTIFKVGLLPYLRLAIAGMRINTLVEHKEVVVVCEESGLISLSYNAPLTTLETNIVVKLIIHVVTIKSTLTYTNCGKTSHSIETYHNKKIEVPLVPTATIKPTEPKARTKTQLIKSRKIHVRYPCIICCSVEHIYG
jgi:hypothetical protein